MTKDEAKHHRDALRAWSARLRTTNPDPPIVALNVAAEMAREADSIERAHALPTTRST